MTVFSWSQTCKDWSCSVECFLWDCESWANISADSSITAHSHANANGWRLQSELNSCLPAWVLCIYSAQQTACRGSFSFLTMTCVLFCGQYFWWVNSTQSETPGTQHRLCFSSVLDDSFNQTVLVCVLRLLLHSNTSVQINFHKLLKAKTPLDSSLNINTVTWSPETISSLLCGDVVLDVFYRTIRRGNHVWMASDYLQLWWFIPGGWK